MDTMQFKAITKDINKNAEGDAVELRLLMKDGNSVAGAWQFLPGSGDSVVVLTGAPDAPPLYIPLDNILIVMPEPV